MKNSWFYAFTCYADRSSRGGKEGSEPTFMQIVFVCVAFIFEHQVADRASSSSNIADPCMCIDAIPIKDTIEIMKWNTSNFEGLVLGCIDSYDSEKRRIFQDFSSSTRFLCLRTANTSKFQQKTVKLFGRNEMKFHFIPILVNEFGHFSAKFWWNFVRISRIFSENDEMSRDSHK